MVQLAPDNPPVHSSNLTWASVGDKATMKAIYAMLTHRQICNSSHNLEPGHFWPENPSYWAWLDRHPVNPVIYVAFGSFTVLDRTQFRELALGLELTGQPFLWVVRPDMAAGKKEEEEEEPWPEGFIERVGEGGLVVGWTPQQRVLCHPSVGCFVIHCGWNSTVEGVWGVVPFVCCPYFADQFMNETYVCDEWRVGVRLRRDERGTIGHAEIKEKVERVLSDKGYKERAVELKGRTMESVEGENLMRIFKILLSGLRKVR